MVAAGRSRFQQTSTSCCPESCASNHDNLHFRCCTSGSGAVGAEVSICGVRSGHCWSHLACSDENRVETRLNMEQNRSDLGCVYSRTETLECPNVVGIIDCIWNEERSKQPRNVRLVAYAVILVTTNAAIKAPQIDGRCTLTPPVFVGLGALAELLPEAELVVIAVP